MTMLGFYLINACMDLVTFYKVPAPPDLDYLSASLAFFIEGFLFSEHLHGRSMLDQKVHTLLYYSIYLAAVFAVLEMARRDSWAIGMVRISAIMVHGAWMVQNGFILYPKWVNSNWSSWEPEGHEQMMILPMMLAWYIMGVILWQVVIMAIMYRKARAMFGPDQLRKFDITQYTRLTDQADELA